MTLLEDVTTYLEDAVDRYRKDPELVSWKRVKNLNEKLFVYMRAIGDRTAPFTIEDIKRMASEA